MKPKFLLFCSFLFSLSVSAQRINTTELDKLFDSLAFYNKSMASVIMTKNGVKLYERAIGYAVADSLHPKVATPATRYRIGSITKTFTATMIMQLVDEGKLKLDDHLQKYLPGLPNADRITLEMMLRHRSGLHNFTDDEAYWKTMTEPKTRAEMLSVFKSLKPDFDPGTKAIYSNTNYVLLGYILEDITGKSYQENLKKRISDRVGLKKTKFGGKIDPANGDAYSYVFSGKWDVRPETDLSLPAGAGAIVSTAEDITTFIQALFNGKLVSAQSLKQMTTIVDMFGLGLARTPFYQKEGFGHTGGIDGFQSTLVYYPGDSLAAAILSNGVDYPLNDMLIAMLSTYIKAPFVFPNFGLPALKPEELDQYMGVYSSTQLPVKFTVSRRNTTLLGQADGQPSFILTPYEKNKFKFDGAGLLLEFFPGENRFIATQMKDKYEFKKVTQ